MEAAVIPQPGQAVAQRGGAQALDLAPVHLGEPPPQAHHPQHGQRHRGSQRGRDDGHDAQAGTRPPGRRGARRGRRGVRVTSRWISPRIPSIGSLTACFSNPTTFAARAPSTAPRRRSIPGNSGGIARQKRCRRPRRRVPGWALRTRSPRSGARDRSPARAPSHRWLQHVRGRRGLNPSSAADARSNRPTCAVAARVLCSARPAATIVDHAKADRHTIATIVPTAPATDASSRARPLATGGSGRDISGRSSRC